MSPGITLGHSFWCLVALRRWQFFFLSCTPSRCRWIVLAYFVWRALSTTFYQCDLRALLFFCIILRSLCWWATIISALLPEGFLSAVSESTTTSLIVSADDEPIEKCSTNWARRIRIPAICCPSACKRDGPRSTCRYPPLSDTQVTFPMSLACHALQLINYLIYSSHAFCEEQCFILSCSILCLIDICYFPWIYTSRSEKEAWCSLRAGFLTSFLPFLLSCFLPFTIQRIFLRFDQIERVSSLLSYVDVDPSTSEQDTSHTGMYPRLCCDTI